MKTKIIVAITTLAVVAFGGVPIGLTDVPPVGRNKALYGQNPTNNKYVRLIGVDKAGMVAVGDGSTTISLNALQVRSSLSVATFSAPTTSMTWVIPTSAAVLTTGNVNLLFNIGGTIYKVKANTGN